MYLFINNYYATHAFILFYELCVVAISVESNI